MSSREFIESNIERVPFSGCWLWTGKLQSKGYGMFRNGAKMVLAHRASFVAFKGDTGSLNVLHRCDVPACVNPEHLWLGTQSDNLKDAYKKGRKKALHGPSKKTHCPQGHEYTAINTSFRPNGHRRCAQCHRDQERARSLRCAS